MKKLRPWKVVSRSTAEFYFVGKCCKSRRQRGSEQEGGVERWSAGPLANWTRPTLETLHPSPSITKYCSVGILEDVYLVMTGTDPYSVMPRRVWTYMPYLRLEKSG